MLKKSRMDIKKVHQEGDEKEGCKIKEARKDDVKYI